MSIALGLMLVLAFAGPASAEVIITDEGTHGDANIFDSEGFPGAKCGYGAENAAGVAKLRWIRVFSPAVQAADVTGAVDQQKVSFQVKIQRAIGTGAWSTVASSVVRAKTAYDNSYAYFDPIRAYVNGTSYDETFRALMILRWMRNGSVDGLVKARIVYYSVKWTVGTPDYIFEDGCTGKAD